MVQAAAEAGGNRVGAQLPRNFLFHLHEWHWNSACVIHQSVHGTKAIRRVQGFTGQSRHQFQPREPFVSGSRLTKGKHHPPDASSSEGRVGVHRSDASCFHSRVEQASVTSRRLVAPIKRRSATPASAPRDDAFGFDHEVRPIINELGIEPHDRAARLDLRIVEKVALEFVGCRVHYFDERRNVVLNGKSAREVHCASVAHLSSNDHVEPEGSSQGETALVQAAAEFKPTAQQFSPSRDTLSSTFPADRPLPRRAHGRALRPTGRPVLGALRTLRHLGCPRDHPAGGYALLCRSFPSGADQHHDCPDASGADAGERGATATTPSPISAQSRPGCSAATARRSTTLTVGSLFPAAGARQTASRANPSFELAGPLRVWMCRAVKEAQGRQS